MCLASETHHPFTSTAEISCYKILIPVGGKLLTPYRDFCFPVGEVMVDQAEDDSRIMWGVRMIESGYFHSYYSLEKAKAVVAEIDRKYKKKCKIYHAVIPKGTEYFRGQFEDMCSKSLKIIEECLD